MVRVLPDQPAIDKRFDYLVPDSLGDQVRVGSQVRVELHGRRVGAWVVEDGAAPPPGVTLKAVAKVTGWGPTPELIELATWASWRWAGRAASFLRTASPERAVRNLPAVRARTHPVSGVVDEVVTAAFAHERAVLRLPPVADGYEVALAAAGRGHALVLVPSVAAAAHLALRLRRAGVEVANHPRDWAKARAGATVVGTRAAAWAPVIDLAAVVVLDEHDEGWQQEQAPTWHARDVAIERARRAGAPCVVVSPMPSLEALGWGRLVTTDRNHERAGWPIVDVVDRRDDPPGSGLFSDRLARALHDGGRVVCVLNRKGRARLLACARCGELARCERCAAAVSQVVDGEAGTASLVCGQCQAARPTVCLACGGTKLKTLRAGVTRVREELEALARTPVVEVTGETAGDKLPDARVYVGTEAVLHQVPGAEVVAFLDFDQELLAPRYRAAEEAMALVVRAARLVGGRADGGRVLLQTRTPDHEVIQSALLADPDRLTEAERRRRQLLRFPPLTAMAVVSGPSAPAFMEGFGQPADVQVMGPADGRWLLRADTHPPLLDALSATPRPGGRLRIEVDPLRL